MRTSEDLSKLLPALCVAQSTIQTAKKDKVNPFHKSRYADLASVQESCKTPLLENGLMVIQDVNTSDASIMVTTRIVHSSGQWIEVGPLSVPLKNNDAQSVGSAITYGRRYSLSSMLCIITEDDDGQAAVQEDKKKPATALARTANVEKAISGNKINEEQISTMNHALSLCQPGYVQAFDKHLDREMKVKNHGDILASDFDRLMQGIQNHLNQNAQHV